MQHPCGPVCFQTAAACPLWVNRKARSRHRLEAPSRSFRRSPLAEFASPCPAPSLGSGRCPWCWSLLLPSGSATVCWKAAIASSGRPRSCCPSSACTDRRLPRSGGSRFGSQTTRKLRYCLQNQRNKSNINTLTQYMNLFKSGDTYSSESSEGFWGGSLWVPEYQLFPVFAFGSEREKYGLI